MNKPSRWVLLIVLVVLVGAGIVIASLSLNRTPIQEVPAPPVIVPMPTLTYLTSASDATKFCNGADMDSAGYQKTITVEATTSTSLVNPTKIQLIKAVIHAATTGMCRTVLESVDMTEKDGVVSIPPMDAWAGSSIVMCSCKPLVEVNLRRLPGISNIVWNTTSVGSGTAKEDLIRVEKPSVNQIVRSPLTVTGQARGTWFFEATFPVVLMDRDGHTMAQGTARAKSDWMTTDFVPFEATLTFTTEKIPADKTGTLILRKDNPSGLPAQDDALEIPVKFE